MPNNGRERNPGEITPNFIALLIVGVVLGSILGHSNYKYLQEGERERLRNTLRRDNSPYIGLLIEENLNPNGIWELLNLCSDHGYVNFKNCNINLPLDLLGAEEVDKLKEHFFPGIDISNINIIEMNLNFKKAEYNGDSSFLKGAEDQTSVLLEISVKAMIDDKVQIVTVTHPWSTPES